MFDRKKEIEDMVWNGKKIEKIIDPFTFPRAKEWYEEEARKRVNKILANIPSFVNTLDPIQAMDWKESKVWYDHQMNSGR